MSDPEEEPIPAVEEAGAREERRHPGTVEPDAFWNDFLTRLVRTTEAARVLVLVREGNDWKTIRSAVSRSRGSASAVESFTAGAGEFATRLATGEGGPFLLEGESGARVVGRIFEGLSGNRLGAVLLLFTTTDGAVLERAQGLLGFAVSAPVAYHTQQQLAVASERLDQLFRVVDGMATVLPRQRFREAALAFCNRVATDLGAEQVFLGWGVSGSAKVLAISRTESFNRKMNLVEAIEKAMDECIDQDEPVVAPPPSNAMVVSRAHQQALQSENFGHLLSVPLKDGEETVAVVTVQRSGAPFADSETQRLVLLADLLAPRLVDLRRTDRWFGARMLAGTRRMGSRIVGPTHTWTKLGAIAGALVLGFLFFYQMAFRVEGSFTLRSEELRTLPAPFDGYLAEVLVSPGDPVVAGQVLALLDDEDIRLERDAAAAELQRYQREAEKARVARQSAEMRIAEALAAEAAARLEIAEYRLQRTTITAPVDGLILEGDLRERIDAPLRQGDLLFTIAPPGDLYAEVTVEERDIHWVETGAGAEIALVARPEERIAATVALVEPAGFPGAAGNTFTVRIDPDSSAEWWRPGMSGVAKIHAGEKTLIWILTHRTVDFLRMYFWL